MNARAAQIETPDAALEGDEGLRAVWALRLMAERALIHGNAAEKAMGARLLDYLDRGAEGGLDAALGLTGPGWSGALTRYRLDRRDADLRRLWRAYLPDLSAHAAAMVIAQQWRREAALSPRTGGGAPLQEPRASLRRLIEAGHRPIGTDRLRKVLAVGHLQTVENANPPDDL